MSWIAVTGGYLIQCDQCGYIRGSLFLSDGVKSALKHGRGRAPFQVKRVPSEWHVVGPAAEEMYLCPECNAGRISR